MNVSSSTSAPRTRCRACFFALPPVATTPLPSDVPLASDSKRLFSGKLEDFALLVRSRDRGCATCASLHAAVLARCPPEDVDALLADASLSWSDRGIFVTYDRARGKEGRRRDYETLILDLFQPVGGEDAGKTIPPAAKQEELRSVHPFAKIAAVPPENGTSSDESFATIRSWIETCAHRHPICSTGLPGLLPGRVLQIKDAGQTLQVAEMSAPTRANYAALSHRWGPDTAAASLVKANMAEYRKGISIASLPRLFRDAVGVCTRLDMEFLWIDSLCIVQDSLEDWGRVAAEMADIYANAFLTIAGTCADGSSEGLFSEPGAENKHAPTKIADFASPTSLVTGTDMPTDSKPILLRIEIPHLSSPFNSGSSMQEYDVSNLAPIFPLLARGWVFQERILSRRVLHFTPRELVWECRAATRCECRAFEGEWAEIHRETADRGNDVGSGPRGGIGGVDWHAAVYAYSQLALTFHKDKLPALAGVARRVSEERARGVAGAGGAGEYCMGLWAGTLSEDIMWVRNVKGLSSAPGPRPEPRTAPTWSWASIGERVLLTSLDGGRVLADVEEVRNLGGNDADPFMGSEGAELVLVGPLVRGTLVYDQTQADWDKMEGMVKSRRTVWPYKYAVRVGGAPDDADDTGSTDSRGADESADTSTSTLVGVSPDYALHLPGEGYVPSGAEVACMTYCKFDRELLCLVMRPVVGFEGKERRFERIGWTEKLAPASTKWFESLARRETVVIN